MKLRRPVARDWIRPASLILALAMIALPARGQNRQDRTQNRPAGQRIEVPVDDIEVDDGDTVTIVWGWKDREIVWILGIDTPEISHPQHNLPFDQPFGREAAGFARGVLSVADRVEILRADTKDPYGRSLAYLFVNGRNYSELVLRAGLAVESVSRYGDNGLPDEAKKMIEAARAAGPAPFENPGDFRRRMREYSEWGRSHRTVR